ncbi:MAG: periplasmic heavy metal sensor [Pararhodobacter sp.]
MSAAGKARQGSGRGWRVALMLSLAVNLLFVGVLAGGAWRGWRAPPPQGPVHEMRALWQALPDEARIALRAELRARRAAENGTDDGRPARNERPSARLSPLLRADPFDAQGFAAALEDMRDTRADRAAQGQAALVAQIAALPAAERAAVADRLDARLTRRGRGDPRR